MTNKQKSNMQQFLSYQTARRIYGERSYKKYVTKRTLISLTFSIGFFTLIVVFFSFLLPSGVVARTWRHFRRIFRRVLLSFWLNKSTIQNLLPFGNCDSVPELEMIQYFRGFLLGKFVSQRQFKLRQLYEPEMIQLVRTILQAKQSAENMWESSITAFNNDSLPTTFNDSIPAFNQINSNLLAKMKYCGHPIHPILIDSVNFVGQLLNDEMVRLLNCFTELNRLLDDLRNEIV